MATAAYLLSNRVAIGSADQRLADVALHLSRADAHHLIVIHEVDKTFVGLIKLADIAAHSDPGNRILGDLASKTMPVIFSVNESAKVVVDMFEQHRLGEAIVTSEGTYVGLITAESVLQWNRQKRDSFLKIPPLEAPHFGATERPSSTTLEPQSPRAETDQKTFQTTVLLVEDHLPSRKALSSILARRNLRVVEANSVQEALKLFSQHVFALVISDIGLPDGSGLELMAELRRRSNVKAISMTASADTTYFLESKAVGFSFHFTKPLQVPTLDAAIQHLLGGDSSAFRAETKI